MNPSGTTYYSWTTDPNKADPTLISGFLTALNMFAGSEVGEELKEITLNKTTYIFDRSETMVVVILTQDPEFQPVIRLLLPVIRKRFHQRFHELISNFNGDIAPFEGFKTELEDILTSYGYFNYLEVIPKFETDESIECVLYLDNTSGEVLYIKSKKYLDRNLLGFQTMVLIKSLLRAIDNKLRDHLEMVLILTNEGRFVEIKNYENLSIIYESKQQKPIYSSEQLDSSKKWKKLLKKPEEMIAKLQNPVLIYDNSGKIEISHDPLGIPQLKNLPADTVTTYSSVENIVKSVYKETLYGILVLGGTHMYFIFQNAGYNILSVLNYAKCNMLQNNKSDLLLFKINLPQNFELMNGIIEHLNNHKLQIL